VGSPTVIGALAWQKARLTEQRSREGGVVQVGVPTCLSGYPEQKAKQAELKSAYKLLRYKNRNSFS